MGSGLLFYKPMESIERDIIILALDNLISTYSIALENNLTCQNDEDLKLLQFTIEKAKGILYKMAQEPEINKPIDKPVWENL